MKMIKIVLWIWIISVGLIFVFIVPPFQKPDENLHFLRAVSSLNYYLPNRPNKGLIEFRLRELLEKVDVNRIAFKGDEKFDIGKIIYKDNNRDLVVDNYTFGNYWNKDLIGYLPSTLGVYLGTLTNYPVLCLYFSRLIGLFLLLLSVYICQILVRSNLIFIIFGYVVMPMVLHQVTSVGYDVLPLVLAPLVLSLLIKILSDKFNWKYIMSFYLSLILFILAKNGYQSFLILFFIPLIKIFNIKLKYLFLILLVLVVGIIFNKQYLFNKVVLTVPVATEDVGRREIFARDPDYVFGVVKNTLINKQEFYIKGILGYFGWLDYTLDFSSYLLIVILVVFLFVLSIGKTKFVTSIPNLVFIWALLFFGVILVVFVFYFVGSADIGTGLVEGVQGRYFLVFVPFFLFSLNQTVLCLGSDRSKLCIAVVFLLLLGNNILKQINGRYYDYSKIVRNEDGVVRMEGATWNQPLEWEKIDKKIQFNIPILKNKTVGGIQLDIEKDNLKENIGIPYRYVIKDSNCNKVMKKGYLVRNAIQTSGIYKQLFFPFKTMEDVACVEIEPLITSVNKKNNYLKIKRGINDHMFGLLYVGLKD